VLGRTSNVKGQMLAFYDTPSDTVTRAYTELRTSLPRAIADANAFLARAATVSQTLKKYDLTLNVPPPVK
jgi:hypothetical protein